MSAPHPADCPCFNCIYQHLVRFQEQLAHEPWYERETVEAPARCPDCDEPYATADHECECGGFVRCSLCEVREDEHSEPFPCRWYPQD